MARHPQAIAAAAFCSLMLLAVPVAAQSAGAPGATPAASLSKALPLRREEPAAAASTVSVVAGAMMLAVAVAAIFLVARRKGVRGVMPWRPARAGTTPIIRLASQALTPQASVHAIQWSGEELLLACTPQQVTVLARRPLAPPLEPT